VTYGLTPEKETLEAMFHLAPLMDRLARERVFSELCKLLPLLTAEDLRFYAPVLTQPIPELQASLGFCQHSPYHRYDVFTHTAYVVENTPPELALRWAALLHDVEKPGVFYQDETGRGHFPNHAGRGADTADAILLRLKAPTALREEVTLLIRQHMLKLPEDKRLLRRWLGKRGQSTVLHLLTLQEADMRSKGYDIPVEVAQFPVLRNLIAEIMAEKACLTIKDLAIDGKDLQSIGIPAGPEMGKVLNRLLEMVQDELIPNEKEALLAAAQ
jgi:tRNA nucleotidyltransferase (CCA-adding enzyme)